MLLKPWMIYAAWWLSLVIVATSFLGDVIRDTLGVDITINPWLQGLAGGIIMLFLTTGFKIAEVIKKGDPQVTTPSAPPAEEAKHD